MNNPLSLLNLSKATIALMISVAGVGVSFAQSAPPPTAANTSKMEQNINNVMQNINGVQGSQGQATSNPNLDKYRTDAQRVGRSLFNDGRTVDADGKVIKGNSTNSVMDAENTSRIVKKTLGVDLNDPATRAGNLKTVRDSVLNCTKPSRQLYFDGVVLDRPLCTYQGKAITGIQTKVCDRGLYGASCVVADFYDLKIPSGSRVKGANYVINVTCDQNAKSCQLTGGLTGAVTGNSAAAATAASEKVKSEMGTNSAYQVTLESGTSMTVANAAEELNNSKLDCFKQQQKDLADGRPARSCDGVTAVAQAGGGQGSGTATSCTADLGKCLNSSQVTSSFTKQCEVAYEATSLSCQKVIDTRECRIQLSPKSGTCESGDYQENGQCYAKTDSCSSGERVGFTLMKSTKDNCSNRDFNGVCLSYTEYLWDPANPKSSGQCEASPFPLGGSIASSCANKGQGKELDCAADGWYLRTLPASACSVTTSVSVDGGVDTLTSILSEKDKPGCGYCIKPIYVDACRGQKVSDTCTSVKADNCKLTSNECNSATSLGGASLCTTATQKYTCTKTESVCTQYENNSACSIGAPTYGVENIKVGSTFNKEQQLNDLVVATGIVRALAQTSTMYEGLPQVFNGESRRCRIPRNIVKGVGLGNNCCALGLERPGGKKGTLFQNCDIGEVKLAGSRRAERAVYVPGPWCSKSIKVGFGRICIEESFGYCDFNDKLTRIIHEQGRQQLADYAASTGANVKTSEVNYDYVGVTQEGNWKDLGKLNGVKLAVWQWPAVCKNPSLDTSGYCPSQLQTWVAACDDEQNCKELPPSPWYTTGAWVTTPFDPMKQDRAAVSRFAIAQGGCSSGTGKCSYEFKAYPVGIGGKAVLTRNIQWPIDVREKAEGPYVVLGNAVMKPILIPGEVSKQTVMALSTNGGKSFREVVLSHEKPIRIADPDIEGTIRCNSYEGTCYGEFTGTIKVDLKPWGNGPGRDCSGFTVSQISALDFARMDFSEWIEDIKLKVKDQYADGASAVLKTQIDAFLEDAINEKPKKIVKPETIRAVEFSHLEEFGPFQFTAKVQGNWPTYTGDPDQDKDPVRQVTIDFDDCKGEQLMEPYLPDGTAVADATRAQLAATPFRYFRGVKNYLSPDKECKGGPVDRIHNVVIKVYSASGTHTVTQQIRNVWSDPAGTIGKAADLNGRVESTVEVPAPKIPDQFKDQNKKFLKDFQKDQK